MSYSKIIKSVRVADLSGSVNEMVNYYNEQDLTAYPDYVPMVDELKTQAEALVTALNKSKAQSDLADLDAVRDDAVSAISALAEGYLNVPTEPIQSAAQLFWSVFSKYGVKINHLSYAAESGQIRSFFDELNSTLNLDTLDNLPHMKDLLNNLNDAQDAFEAAEVAYDTRSAELKNEDTASSLKPLVLSASNVIVDYHNAIVGFKDAAFKEMAEVIEKIINDLNIVTKQRSKKAD